MLNRWAASSFLKCMIAVDRDALTQEDWLVRESDHQSLATRCGVRLAARMNAAASKAERA